MFAIMETMPPAPNLGRRPGRPRLDPSARRKPVTISLPLVQVEFMTAWARARRVTMSRAIQQLILKEQAAAQRAAITSGSHIEVLHRLRQSATRSPALPDVTQP